MVVDEGEWLFSGPWQFTLGDSHLLLIEHEAW
jgi:hypothetical protein